MPARRHVLSSLALSTILALAACSGNGSVTLPTQLPSVSLPTVPSISRPSVTVPSLTVPPLDGGARETRTITSTQTQTQTQTQTVTATPAPTTSAAAPTQPADGGTTWWPWVVAALVVALILAALLARGRRRAGWDRRLRQAQVRASWFEGSLVPQLQGAATAAEATSRWHAAQPDLLELDQDLHTLVSEAPDEARRGRASILRERVAELVQAEGAEASVSGAHSVDELRALRSRVDQARGALREVLPEQVRDNRQ